MIGRGPGRSPGRRRHAGKALQKHYLTAKCEPTPQQSMARVVSLARVVSRDRAQGRRRVRHAVPCSKKEPRRSGAEAKDERRENYTQSRHPSVR